MLQKSSVCWQDPREHILLREKDIQDNLLIKQAVACWGPWLSTLFPSLLSLTQTHIHGLCLTFPPQTVSRWIDVEESIMREEEETRDRWSQAVALCGFFFSARAESCWWSSDPENQNICVCQRMFAAAQSTILFWFVVFFSLKDSCCLQLSYVSPSVLAV